MSVRPSSSACPGFQESEEEEEEEAAASASPGRKAEDDAPSSLSSPLSIVWQGGLARQKDGRRSLPADGRPLVSSSPSLLLSFPSFPFPPPYCDATIPFSVIRIREKRD